MKPIPPQPKVRADSTTYIDTREFFEYRKAVEAYILSLEQANELLRLQVLGR
jgi:hypothetical protein